MKKIHSTAVIHPDVIIEDDVYIGPLCVIGFRAEHKGHLDKEGKVIIKRGAHLEGLVTVDSGTVGLTVIGQGCMLMKHTHVGHDAILDPYCTLSPHACVGGHTYLMEGVNMGMHSVVHQCHKIGAYSMIGMGAVIPKGLEVEPFGVYVGVPAKRVKDNQYPIDKNGFNELDVHRFYEQYFNL